MQRLSRLKYWSSLILILIIALFLRVPLLAGSFWLDEAAQALESVRPLSQQLDIAQDFQPPLLHLWLHFGAYLGTSEWWLRTLGALLPGLATIYFTYRIGQLVHNKATGALAALFLATSSFHIFYSQELRPYSLPAMFAAASWFILILLEQGKEVTRKDWLWLVLTTAGGLYSSYLYPFVIIGQGSYLLWKKRSLLQPGLVSLAGGGVLFLPWLPFFLEQLRVGTTLQQSLPGWSTVVSINQLKSLPLVVVKFVFGVANVEPNLVYIGALGLLFGLTGWLIWQQRRHLPKEVPVLAKLSAWLIVPIITAWLISFFVPVVQPKRVLFALPAFYLLLSYLLIQAKPAKHKAAQALVGVILVINLLTTAFYWKQPQLQRENWRNLVQEIEKDYTVGSVAVFAFPAPFAPWEWYASESYPTIATETIYLDDPSQARTIMQQALEYNHVLVFDYLRDLTDPNNLLEQSLVEYGYKPTGLYDYPNIGFVRIYSKPEAVISYRQE